MNLVKLQCPECGASLEVGTEKEYFFCTYCGTKLTIPKMAVKYEIITRDETRIETSKHEARTKMFSSASSTIQTIADLALKAFGILCITACVALLLTTILILI